MTPGSSAGDCKEKDLRELVSVLGLDKLGKLESSSNSSSTDDGTTTPFKISGSHSTPASSSNGKRTVSSMPLGTSPRIDRIASTNQDQDIDQDDNDDDDNELMEVTPDVQMFIGHSHFLADMNGGGGGAGSASHSDEDTPLPVNSQQQQQQHPRLKSTDHHEQVEAKETSSSKVNGIGGWNAIWCA